MPVYDKNSSEYRLLSEISGHLAVEFDGMATVKKTKIAIMNSCWNVNPQGTINDLVDNHFVKIEDDKYIIFSNNDKGGEKMKEESKKDSSCNFTSGETKVAKAVIRYFADGFKIRNPSREVFENCLETAFPKIKNGKASTTKMIEGKYLEEKEGKIFIGKEGEKILSP